MITRDHLSQTFAALADPTRRAMLARLSAGEASVGELARPFLGEMSLPAVTKHLQVLERAGLVTKTREAQWRPCKLNGAPLREAVDWMEQYRAFWEESFDRLGEYLKSIQAEGSAQAAPKTETRKTKKKNANTKSRANTTPSTTGASTKAKGRKDARSE